jgi:hypothetical protein
VLIGDSSTFYFRERCRRAIVASPAGFPVGFDGGFHEQVFDNIDGLQPHTRRQLRASPTKYEQAKHEADHHQPERAANHDKADHDKPCDSAEADAGAKTRADTPGAVSFSLEHAKAQSRRCANSFHCHDARIQAGTAEVQTDRGSKSGGNQAVDANNGFGSKIYGDGFGPKDHHDCDRVGSQNRDGNHDDSKQEALNVFPAHD